MRCSCSNSRSTPRPLSWARYAEFVADGGYDDAQWWSPEGWAWVQAEGRRAPRYVEQMRQGVLVQRQGQMQRVGAAQAAVHVSRHEAQAWCRWAGRRLPTEPEWELAALTGASRGFVFGDVFEWTGGSARAWPGGDGTLPGFARAARARALRRAARRLVDDARALQAPARAPLRGAAARRRCSAAFAAARCDADSELSALGLAVAPPGQHAAQRQHLAAALGGVAGQRVELALPVGAAQQRQQRRAPAGASSAGAARPGSTAPAPAARSPGRARAPRPRCRSWRRRCRWPPPRPPRGATARCAPAPSMLAGVDAALRPAVRRAPRACRCRVRALRSAGRAAAGRPAPCSAQRVAGRDDQALRAPREADQLVAARAAAAAGRRARSASAAARR